MNTTTRAISPLRQRMIEDMRMRKLTPKKQSSYIRAVRRFAGYLGRSPGTASAEDLRRYQQSCGRSARQCAGVRRVTAH
jgi:integrase/recombinase XerD